MMVRSLIVRDVVTLYHILVLSVPSVDILIEVKHFTREVIK